MFFIRDCRGKVIGRESGYRTHAAALAQCNRRGASVYLRIWRTYENEMQINPQNNLLYSIVHFTMEPINNENT